LTKKAIVIGASSGIGKELAIVLAENGYEVGLMARRVDLLEALKKEIPTKSYVGHMDVTMIPDALEKFRNMIQNMEGADLVIINSGIGYKNNDLDWPKEEQTLDVNVKGFCALAGEAFKTFKKQGHGHLVGISSIAALRGNPFAPAYGASKAFMSSYLEALSVKAYRENPRILVTDIKPGFVDTAMIDGKQTFWVASARKAAEQIVAAIKKGKRHAYITHRWRLIAWLIKLAPHWLYKRFG
jgi:short-subunit dehydrogenase